MSVISEHGSGGHDSDPTPPVRSIQGPSSNATLCSDITATSPVAIGAPGSSGAPIEIGQPAIPASCVLRLVPDDVCDGGNDSDGETGPFHNNMEDVEDSPEMQEEEVNVETDGNGGAADANNGNPESVPSVEEVQKMKVAEMREWLKKRGLPVNGLKKDLTERVSEAIQNGVPLLENMTDEQQQNIVTDSCYPPGTHWKLIDPGDGEVVDESIMTVEGVSFHGPTAVPAENTRDGADNGEGGGDRRISGGAIKKNYSETFDRAPFIGQRVLLPEKRESGKGFKMERKNGKDCFKYHLAFSNETLPNLRFVFDNELGFNSRPADWLEAFLPLKRGRDTPSKLVTLQDLTAWTNTKALLANAGMGGGKYKDFKAFTLKETRSFLGLHILQGLSPSPSIDMKFSSQEEDPVNGNDMCHKVFGKNGRTRYKEFKCFFASVNPLITPPPRERSPNHKIDPLLHHLLFISKKAMHVGKDISVDEMDISFQGSHADKQRITYKRAGDGFLVDALCADGYCYSFYFRNQKAPDKWLKKELSPLHSRVMALFEQLPQNTSNYQCRMDNLFMSVKFAKFAKCAAPISVMIHGVTRPSGRGVPKCIEQNLVTKKDELEKVRGTLKVAVLDGDPSCKVVAASLYDTKPVYIVSTSCEKVEWIKKERKLYHSELGKKVTVPFFRLNLIDDYNMNMNNVDLADQLRLQYRIHTIWTRNRKWWWSIFFWSFETLLTNCYLVYKKFFLMHNRKVPLSHYDFLKAISLCWINPDTVEYSITAASLRSSDPRSSSSSSSSTASTTSTAVTTRKRKRDESNKKKNATRFTTLALHPQNGSLNGRLNHVMFSHLATRSDKKEASCQLCHFIKNKRVRAQLLKCEDCNVILCVDCYKTFHTVDDLVAMRHKF